MNGAEFVTEKLHTFRMYDRTPSDHDHLFRQREASLTRNLIVPEPVRHENDLTSSKEQEDQQHAEVEARVERRSQDVVPPRPKRVPVAVRPKHYHEPSNQTAGHSCADITPEMRHCAEEDRCVP